MVQVRNCEQPHQGETHCWSHGRLAAVLNVLLSIWGRKSPNLRSEEAVILMNWVILLPEKVFWLTETSAGPQQEWLKAGEPR